MVLDSPIISGSATFLGNLVVTGSITTLGSITISGSIASASYATNTTTASYAVNTTTASYATNTTTASYAVNTTTASYAINSTTASYAVNTTTSSYALNTTTASYAATSSYANTFTVANTLTAQTLVVQTITSSVDFITGSTRFGSLLANTHQVTGSLLVTGSTAISGPLTGSNALFTLSTAGGFVIKGVSATPTNLAYLANNYFPKFYTRPDQNFGITIFDQSTATAIQSADIANGVSASVLALNPYGGNVGIGITNPSALLHVSGGTDYNTIFSSTSNRSGWVINTPGTNSPGGSGLVLASDGSFRFGNASQYQIAMYTSNEVGIFGGGSERLRVTSGGNVGIGTTSPEGPLHIYGNNGGGYVGMTIVNYNGTLSTAAGIDFGVDPSTSYNGAGNGQIKVINTNASSMAADMIFSLWNGSAFGEKVKITSTGGLELNTAGPGLFTLGASTSYAGISSGGGGVTFYMNGATRGGTTTAASNVAVLALDGNYYITNGAVNSNRMILTTVTPGTIHCLLVNKTTPSTSYPIQTTSGNGGFMASATGGGDANYYSTSATIGYHIYGDQGGGAKFSVTGGGKGYFAAGVQFGNGSSTMNYYEEGTWTPQLYAGSTAFTMSGINDGRYIRIGNQVTVTGHIQWSGGSGSGMVKVSGLPFASSGVRSAGSIGAVSYGISFDSGYGSWIIVNDPGYSFFYIIELSSSGGGYSHTPPVGSSGVIYGFALTYFIV